jgi:hypothetical protein
MRTALSTKIASIEEKLMHLQRSLEEENSAKHTLLDQLKKIYQQKLIQFEDEKRKIRKYAYEQMKQMEGLCTNKISDIANYCIRKTSELQSAIESLQEEKQNYQAKFKEANEEIKRQILAKMFNIDTKLMELKREIYISLEEKAKLKNNIKILLNLKIELESKLVSAFKDAKQEINKKLSIVPKAIF